MKSTNKSTSNAARTGRVDSGPNKTEFKFKCPASGDSEPQGRVEFRLGVALQGRRATSSPDSDGARGLTGRPGLG